MRTKIASFSAFLLLLVPLAIVGAAQEQKTTPWEAPEADKQVKNPEKVTKEGLDAAAKIFSQNCTTCHGDGGAGDGPFAASLTPHPANFTDEKMMSKATDGELFWKITTGRDPMPSWKSFSETERWQLVNYLRTLADKAKADKK